MQKFALIGLGLASTCGSSAEPARPSPPSAATLVVVPPPTAAPPPPLAPEPTGVVRVEQPAAPVCTFHSAAMAIESDLYARPDGALFARITGKGPAQLLISEGGDPFLEITRGGITLRGHVSRGRTMPGMLRPARSLVLGGFVVPNESARFVTLGASAGRLTVRVEAIQGLTLASPIEQSVACDDLGLDETSADLTAALPSGKPLRQARLAPHGKASLAIEPKGSAVAIIASIDDAADDVVVLAERDGQARITLSRGASTVFGWVPSRALTRRPPPIKASETDFFGEPMMDDTGFVSGLGTNFVGGPTPGTGAAVSRVPPRTPARDPAPLLCAHDVRLLAQMALPADNYQVGTLQPKTPIHVLAAGATFTRIVLLEVARSPKDATFVVPTRDLADCNPSGTP